MTEEEFILQDRIAKIQSVIEQYGEDNFCISFSGGKDSCVLSALVDMAIPGNKIPRVYANTGIEWNMVRNFVFDMQKEDNRIQIIAPKTPIKRMLEEEGYPFKSKRHSEILSTYQKHLTMEGMDGLLHYTGQHPDGKIWAPSHSCPKRLLYQFTPDFKLKISDKCCKRLKEDPIKEWQKNNKRPFSMLGLMREEGGRRENAKCIRFKDGKFKSFQPLVVLTKDWENWFIKEYDIKIPDIYYPPYNFDRTGCKGCPFSIDLQRDLDIAEEFFPEERAQCEIIWKPVYDEYRRIGYRLKDNDES